jgi:hypothetical protein
MDVERFNNYFLTRPLLHGTGEIAVSRTNNVPEFLFATVSESEICDAVMPIRSDAAGVDEIPLSFIKLLLPLVRPVLTHIFNHIFVSSEFPGKWKTSVVWPIPKVSGPAKFFDYRPISLFVCLSKVFEVIMAQQMERHIRCNNLLTVFQFRFRRPHSRTAALLKVTEDIRLSMEDGQVTVLLLLDFSQAFDLVVHELLLCKLLNAQNYSVGAGMLVRSVNKHISQFVRSGGQESFVEL